MRKPGPARETPPPLELLCLRALWSLERASVKDVREAVMPTRPLAYTTVMTVLDRLVRRGMITRQKSGRAFLYSPAVSRDAMRRLALKDFVDAYFEGSQDELLQFLQGQPRAGLPATGSLDPVLL